MSKKQNVKINLVYSICYQILALILPLITMPYISRVLGAEGVGIYSYTSAVALYFIYFGMLGVSNYGNRSVACSRDNRKSLDETFSSIYALQLATSVIALVIYVIYVCVCVKSNRQIAFIQIIYVLTAAIDISWFFFGMEEFKITTTRQMFIRIATLICTFVFVKESTDLWKYTLIMSLGHLMSCVSLWFFLKARVSFTKISLKRILSHLKPSLILFVPLIATSVFGVMDKVMIGNMSSMLEEGYYESADKIITMSSAVFAAFNAVLMPKISNLMATHKQTDAKRYFDTSIDVIMCLAIAICFGVIAVANEFVPIFFGVQYERSIMLMIGLALGIPFVGWAQIFRVLYLLPAGKDQIYLQSTLYGAAINFILNVILIYFYQAMGAVVATVVSQAFIAFFQSFRVRNEVKNKQYVGRLLAFSINGIIMTIIVRIVARVVNNDVFGLVIEVVVGGVVYIIGTITYMVRTQNPLLDPIVNFVKKKMHIK